MTYDHELTLIGATSYIEDEVGNQIPVPAETDIYCGLRSIGRNEFYNAAVTDMRPEIIFVIHPYEYNGEKQVRFKAKDEEESAVYKVIRTYQKGTEEMELICERVGADG